MSKNIPAPTSVSVSSLEQVGRKKPKRKISRVRLPTPPPDPTTYAVQENDTEAKKPVAEKTDEFLEYLENLQKGVPHQNLIRTNSLFAPVIATEDAFDHLEKLYKLMEQMLLLREQNAKLHRRVRDLEHFKKIQNIEKYAENVSNADVSEVDTVLAENLLDSILTDSKRDIKTKPAYPFRFRQSILRKQRNNSTNIPPDKHGIDMERLQESYRRTSSTLSGPDKKVSKWTKVKAAFRWERASQTVNDVKSQDSGISGMQPVNCEVARYLRVPSTSEDPGASPTDSGACEISTPGTISSTSSTEDVFCQGRRGIREDSSDDDQSFTLEYIPNSKDDSINLQKSPNGKGSRTTWAKMKDIIQTRNSVKKRNRLSGKSDDFRSDELMVSDEEVFESKESKSPVSFTKNGSEKYSSLEESMQIPLDVIARYQQAAMEDNIFRDGSDRSKWARVKRAFLSTPSISRVDNNCSPSSALSEGHCVREDQETSPKTENHNKLQEEIQKNYRDLQTKLSLEFQEKMREWEKMKQSSSNSATFSNTATGSALSPEEVKEQAFKKKMEEWEKIKGQPKHNMQLQSEEHLPLEFRKKLQEWQKMKKTVIKDDSSSNNSSQKKKLGEWPKWKSVSGQRTEFSPSEQQPLSEDFIKKLETWKQIKSNSYGNDEERKMNKTPSPKLLRKDGGSSRQSKKIKEQTEKELQWFEKELNKIDREKQRLERERQKFLEREERLTKLRKSVMGDNKQNILVQTPSGFYRFEGISRKFTQKLYEWEKAQGIGPEASTFALLSKCYVPNINSNNKHDSQSRLIKSKSADSIMNSDLNLTHPLLSQQPSSLSLNDMENLENECMLNDAMPSESDILVNEEVVDGDEPEAVIVEVEDIIEETAAPLMSFMEKKQTPVYQQQEISCMCEGEAKAAPKVQRSESTRAQSNYNLIEEIIDLLKLIIENENNVGYRESSMQRNSKEDQPPYITECLKNLYALQTDSSARLIEKLVILQEANTKVTATIVKEETDYTTSRFVEVLDSVQDLSVDLLQLAERLHTELLSRSTSEITFNSQEKYSNLMYMLQQLNSKILELRRVLSYLCAASDSTAPSKKKKIQRNAKVLLKKSSSKEKDKSKQRNSSKDTSSSKGSPLRQRSKEVDIDSDEDLNTQIAQGAIKKRYRFRQKGVSDKAIDESDDEASRLQKKAKKKMQQVVIAENNPADINYFVEDETNISLDPDVIQKVAVPTKLNYVSAGESLSRALTGSPVQVFVKTTRKLFTPLILSSFATESQKMAVTASPTIVSVPSFHRNPSGKEIIADKSINDEQNIHARNSITYLPPLPASPTTQRKMNKEISPNIRLMLAKYNQKIYEQESPGYKSGGSSGSSSPVAWRSPINDRRVRAQTEKYQQGLLKLSPQQVHKSASLGFMSQSKLPLSIELLEGFEKSTVNTKGILKSSSACALTARVRSEQSVTISEQIQPKPKGGSLKLTMPDELNRRLYSDSRSYKIQKAKEKFLNAPLSPVSAPPTLPGECENTVKYPERNRLSQISVDSESCDSSAYEGMLIKSASAGMINVDPETYKQIDPEIHGDGYVSLPRASKKRKEGLMSNIASKFRKVKMRRNKDPNKMNTISTLCRQSLVVDISTGSEETITGEQIEASRKDSLSVPSDSKGSSSADTSPSTSRSSSWIKKPRLFKPKQ